MSVFPIRPDTLSAYPTAEALAAKLVKKAKWTVGRENYLLADFAAMLLVLSREKELKDLGDWLEQAHPFRGNFNIWDGIAHAQASVLVEPPPLIGPRCGRRCTSIMLP